MHSYIQRVEAAVADLRQGKMIILTDHPDRENEGDIIFPAEKTTPEMVNFMIRHCSGIICLSLLGEQLKNLGVDYMVPPHQNSSQRGTPFTISIEARDNITTGVSAKDRAQTILTAVKDGVKPEEIVKPGHIFPLHARDGGVLERAGHTEGALDLVRIAGFKPAAVICEVMNPDGTMTSGDKLKEFANTHQLQILSIEDIINYRLCHDNLISEEISAQLPLEHYGMFDITVIKEKITGHEHIVLSRDASSTKTPLVRIHSSCVTGDIFGSQRCDCKKQLDYSLQMLSKEGGTLIYLNQEGRGIGLFNKIKAYALQEKGMDTVEANMHLGLPVDSREYYIAAQVLRNKNITDIRLLTNNPLKIEGLKKYGIATISQEKMPIFFTEQNKHYLTTKKEKLNHIF